MKIRNGNVVKLKDGREGMIVYRKNNDQIGINIGNHCLVEAMYSKVKSAKERKEIVFRIGAEDEFSIDEIDSIVRDNKIYS